MKIERLHDRIENRRGGVQIRLTGAEVAIAIDAWLLAHGVIVCGPRTITVNGDLCDQGNVYVDQSGRVEELPLDGGRDGGQGTGDRERETGDGEGDQKRERVEGTLDPLVLRDIQTVVGFVLGNWPGYEDAVLWGDHMRKVDHGFYMAARRLSRGLLKPNRDCAGSGGEG